jgi:hypothetical protein
VLIWVNGPFGGGKTQVAHELQRRVPGSVVCDPEHVGFGLHRMTPPGLRGDFQPERLMRPGWTPRREAFAVARLDHDLDRLWAPTFRTHLRTDDLTVPQVAEQIATHAGLDLLPNQNSQTHQRLLQLGTSLRHVRLD